MKSNLFFPSHHSWIDKSENLSILIPHVKDEKNRDEDSIVYYSVRPRYAEARMTSPSFQEGMREVFLSFLVADVNSLSHAIAALCSSVEFPIETTYSVAVVSIDGFFTFFFVDGALVNFSLRFLIYSLDL